MAPHLSTNWNQVALRVLDDFQLGPARQQPQPLGSAGGFSGAMFWKVFVADQCYCLRRWPSSHPDRDQLRWIHAVLQHVDRVGAAGVPPSHPPSMSAPPPAMHPLDRHPGNYSGTPPLPVPPLPVQPSGSPRTPPLPLPVPTRDGATFVEQAGHLWELTPWLPGAADFRRHPSQARLVAAMQALAEFHSASATFRWQAPFVAGGPVAGGPVAGGPVAGGAAPWHESAASSRSDTPAERGASPGLRQRREFLRELMGDEGRRLASAVACGHSLDLDGRARQMLLEFDRLSPSMVAQVEAVAEQPLVLQPCIRDIWHAHVLLEGERVSGIVDFGAMRVETVCGDVARLLGSLVEDDESGWQVGLAAYERRRPLDLAHRDLVRLFDRTGTLLGGMNWLRWIYLEGRDFDWPRVIQRLDETLARLRHQ